MVMVEKSLGLTQIHGLNLVYIGFGKISTMSNGDLNSSSTHHH